MSGGWGCWRGLFAALNVAATLRVFFFWGGQHFRVAEKKEMGEPFDCTRMAYGGFRSVVEMTQEGQIA